MQGEAKGKYATKKTLSVLGLPQKLLAREDQISCINVVVLVRMYMYSVFY